MFEVRWVERETGEKAMEEHGYYFNETVRILQYRYKYNQAVYSHYPNPIPEQERFESLWTEWQDVPVVIETKE